MAGTLARLLGCTICGDAAIGIRNKHPPLRMLIFFVYLCVCRAMGEGPCITVSDCWSCRGAKNTGMQECGSPAKAAKWRMRRVKEWPWVKYRHRADQKPIEKLLTNTHAGQILFLFFSFSDFDIRFRAQESGNSASGNHRTRTHKHAQTCTQ